MVFAGKGLLIGGIGFTAYSNYQATGRDVPPTVAETAVDTVVVMGATKMGAALGATRGWADKAYQGADGTVRVPYRGRWDKLFTDRRAVNVSHAKIRALGEQAMATLNSGAFCASSAAVPTESPPSSRRPDPSPRHVSLRLEKAQCLPISAGV